MSAGCCGVATGAAAAAWAIAATARRELQPERCLRA
jgi:hypothetical protein